MAVAPAPIFNFRVLFSALAPENPALESGDALAAAGAQAASIVPSAALAAASAQAASGIQAGFAEVSGLNSEIEVEEYREGGRNIGPRRFPRWGRYPNLVLRRGVTSNTALWDWWADVITHSYTLTTTKAPPRRSAVVLLDGNDHKAVAAWFVSNALPERLAGPALNARSSEIAIETLELSHEGILRLQTLPPGV
jgi:phage tail-like protein